MSEVLSGSSEPVPKVFAYVDDAFAIYVACEPLTHYVMIDYVIYELLFTLISRMLWDYRSHQSVLAKSREYVYK